MSSLDPPTYLTSIQNNIRARPISWEGAVRAKTITDEDLKKIKSIDKVRKEQRKQTIESDVNSFVTLLLGGDGSQSIFEAAAKRQDIIHYMLVLLGDIIDDIPALTSALVQHPAPFKPFLPLLKASSNNEDPVPLLTSSVLSGLISHAVVTSSKDTTQLDQALPQLYTYLSTLAKASDAGLQDIAVRESSAVLRSSKARHLFWKQRKETLDPLFDILRSAVGSSNDRESTLYSGGGSIRSAGDSGLSGGVGLQLLYHILLVIWQLSFEGELVGNGLQDEHDIVLLYTGLLRVSPKEKTTRLLLSTLVNLLTTNRQTLLPTAVLARLPALLNSLKSRHLTDEDALEDHKTLTELLEEYTKTQTTFDEYAAELQSGHLRWSPPHRNPTFWRDNARRILDENKGELPRKLAEILSKSWENDKQVLAIGCNDVACLVKEVPEKRQQLEKLGLKGRVMELMQEADESVRWESLRAVGEWLRYSFESKSELPLR
ncbi:H(+)-transporting V1 sector ATPase subunit H [Ascochyta rabiei]|uniref:V-type proton ATPase subunit H n=1 Tax=Didymella rabiei TaxID=5454 RepID=A0A163CYU4_DIDRA|nr:H(+)-transporting V1 sector ATPase subunit H [Ascochyta rabiei]KZM22791.1 proton-transporting ATPase activity, rotational mechanism [Ascochyta rabiei]UPX10805.1 H(+)-transporting V1 sector ATPase subunit H [Ascochyta rabiei]